MEIPPRGIGSLRMFGDAGMLGAFSNSVGHLVRRLHRVHDQIFAQELAGYDITSPQLAVLVAVAERPGIDQVTLSDHIAYDRATIVGLLDRLEAKGFVQRKINPRDRRARALWITPKGETARAEIITKARRVERRLISPLSKEEAQQLSALLRRVLDAQERSPYAEEDESGIA